MNFDLSDDQKLLVDNVSAFLRKRSPVTRLRAMREDPIGWSPDLWREMGEMGWLAILFPEAAGGLGWSMVDAGLVLEQFGSTLVPEPFTASIVLGGMALVKAGSETQQLEFLPAVAEGRETLALAWAEAHSRYDAGNIATRARPHGDSFRLYGQKRFVLNGHAADRLVVSARTAGHERDRQGVSLFLIDQDTPGLRIETLKTMDGQRAAHITLDDVEVGADRLLGAVDQGLPVLEAVIDYGAAAACAEGVGLMSATLGMTRDYLSQREQFGVKIGTFQALQHRMADMFVEAELARGTSILASIKIDSEDILERKRAVSVAKVQLATAGKLVTQQAIQLHGGIGVTDEHDVGLYFKRMHILNSLFGDEEHHLARYAGLPGFEGAVE